MGGRELELCEDCGHVDFPWAGCECDNKCHCGEPTVNSCYESGRGWYSRGLCKHCDAVRCDAYPGACKSREELQKTVTEDLDLRERLEGTLFYTAPNGKTIFRWADEAIALDADPYLGRMFDELLPVVAEYAEERVAESRLELLRDVVRPLLETIEPAVERLKAVQRVAEESSTDVDRNEILAILDGREWI